jgi:hypothetical protein
MCGNFGLLQLGNSPPVDASEQPNAVIINKLIKDNEKALTRSDKALLEEQGRSLHEVNRLQELSLHESSSVKVWPLNASINKDKVASHATLLSPLRILQSQTASTEIRGGQAGGYSSLEYDDIQKETVSITSKRVRLVARKRHALAADLDILYKKQGGRAPPDNATLSVIGHTRFATSSVNQVSGKG